MATKWFLLIPFIFLFGSLVTLAHYVINHDPLLRALPILLASLALFSGIVISGLWMFGLWRP